MSKSAQKPQARPQPDIETYQVARSTGHLLRRAHQVAVAIYSEEVAGDLSPRQFSTLITLYQEPGLLQVQLTDRIGADRSTISELIVRLEKRGLVERRRPDDGDERIAGLYVTEAGATALAQALPGAVKVHERILALMPRHLHEPFQEALEHIDNASGWSKGRMDAIPSAPPDDDPAKRG